MALLTFPDYHPTIATSSSISPRVLQADFGDGYGQRARDGLNSLREDYSIIFKNVPYVDSQIIWDFLRARGGAESFLWTPPRETVAFYDGMPFIPSNGVYSRASGAWGINSSGIPQWFADNIPVLMHDPLTRAPIGYAWEDEDRHNHIAYTGFNTGWSQNGTTRTTTGHGPNGAMQACEVVEDASVSTHQLYQNVSVGSADNITFSVYMKPGIRRYLHQALHFRKGATTVVQYSIVLDTVDKLMMNNIANTFSPNNITGGFEELPGTGGWMRVWVSHERRPIDADNTHAVIRLRDSATGHTTSHAGDTSGVAISLWGPLFEKNGPTFPRPGTYIDRLTAAPAFRAKDVCIMPQRKWICQKFSRQHTSPQHDTIQATFTEVFDL